ncbi:MAG TPA: CvpA family protein, partial [Fluviicola sp.]|nr:CvpA family protein [Fluviicola sp.]
MNFLDLIIILPLIYAAYKGFKHGFIIELFTLLAIIVGIYVGIHFSDYTANWLKNSFGWTSEYTPVVSFTITFLAVGALIYFGGKTIEKMVKIAQLSSINKMLGVVFALVKTVYILSIFFVLIESYDEKSS